MEDEGEKGGWAVAMAQPKALPPDPENTAAPVTAVLDDTALLPLETQFDCSSHCQSRILKF